MRCLNTFLTTVAVAVALAACGTSPEFVDEAEVAPQAAPVAPSQAGDPTQTENLPAMETPPCGLATRAVRAQARRGRYSGVEGFDSQTCPPAGGSDE